MKKPAFLFCALIPLLAIGQANTISIDLQAKELIDPKPITLGQPVTYTFQNVALPVNSNEIKIQFYSPSLVLPGRATDGRSPVVYTFLPGSLPDGCIVTFSYSIGVTQQYIMKILISSTGQVSKLTGASIESVYYSLPLQTDNTQVPPEYNKYQVVVYDPCTSGYRIFRNGTKRGALWYKLFSKKDPDHGVLFLIYNFNTLKYNIALSNSFSTQFTNIPDLFTSISGLIGTGAKAASTASGLATDIYKIIQLNMDLKKLIDANCADFITARQQIIDNVQLNFGVPNSLVNITEGYDADRQKYIDTATSPPGKKYTADNFNTDIQRQYHLPVTPDALVTETISLYNQVIGNKFKFQGNVIQLQNADELQFTLSIAGKTGSTNADLNVNNQSISIPILGGIKMDFSTGFYYSSVRNESYAIRKNLTDSSTASIINEANFNSGAVGVNALLHIYPRLFPGINPSLTFGLGKSLDLNYSILLGGSILIGRQNRVALSGGWNFSNVKALSESDLNNMGARVTVPSSATAVSTYNTFKHGAFLSFSYSFGITPGTQKAASTPPAPNTTAKSPNTGNATGKGNN